MNMQSLNPGLCGSKACNPNCCEELSHCLDSRTPEFRRKGLKIYAAIFYFYVCIYEYIRIWKISKNWTILSKNNNKEASIILCLQVSFLKDFWNIFEREQEHRDKLSLGPDSELYPRIPKSWPETKSGVRHLTLWAT